MAGAGAMPMEARREYLMRMGPRYAQADRAEKGRLLTEMEVVTGLHRKSLLRRLARPTLGRVERPRRPRRRQYGVDVEHVVAVVWESLDYVCAERLQPGLLATARHLAGCGELALTPGLEGQLGQISRATVQRMLTRIPRPPSRLPQRGPEAANRLRQAVPVARIPWDTVAPGHLEVDLVHHGGASAAGEYAHTLQLIDVATGWSERVALLGRSQRAMAEAFHHALARLPFPLIHLHSDNGSEFFNDHLARLFGEELTGLTRSRSRPYHTNDSRFVEQKNATLVRAYVGQLRLDTPEQVAALNALYADLWTYYNLFQPVLRLVGKPLVAGKLRRQWDAAQTPYQRLRTADVLNAEQEADLAQRYARTNPRQLRRQIYRQVTALWQPRVGVAEAAD